MRVIDDEELGDCFLLFYQSLKTLLSSGRRGYVLKS